MVYTYDRTGTQRAHKNVTFDYGSRAKNLSYQGAWDPTAPCVKCGKKALLTMAVIEESPEKQDPKQMMYACHVPHGEGSWYHDCASFALYTCQDCRTVTTLWNQT